MTIYIIRASHANQYELQNYEPLIKKYDIKLVTSNNPLTSTSIPAIKLWSPTDLPSFPYRRQILNRLLGGEQWLWGLEQLVKKDDVLHTAETYTAYTHQAVQLRKRNKIKKIICTCWETIPHNNEKLSRLRSWKKDAYKYVDLFHTPTQRAKEALVIEGVSPKKIKVINYGVDLKRFTNKSSHVIKSKPLVLTVARRVSEKGIGIWNKLKTELEDRLEFRWLDSTPYQHIATEYRQADIFLLPSLKTNTWEEQYGMALVEAMASGLPLITTNTGAIPEVVGQAAILCDPDYHLIHRALTKMLRSPAMARRYQTLAKARAIKHYDRVRQSRLLAELY